MKMATTSFKKKGVTWVPKMSQVPGPKRSQIPKSGWEPFSYGLPFNCPSGTKSNLKKERICALQTQIDFEEEEEEEDCDWIWPKLDSAAPGNNLPFQIRAVARSLLGTHWLQAMRYKGRKQTGVSATLHTPWHASDVWCQYIPKMWFLAKFYNIQILLYKWSKLISFGITIWMS